MATFPIKIDIFELNPNSEPPWSQPGALCAVVRSHNVPQRVTSVPYDVAAAQHPFPAFPAHVITTYTHAATTTIHAFPHMRLSYTRELTTKQSRSTTLTTRRDPYCSLTDPEDTAAAKQCCVACTQMCVCACVCGWANARGWQDTPHALPGRWLECPNTSTGCTDLGTGCVKIECQPSRHVCTHVVAEARKGWGLGC